MPASDMARNGMNTALSQYSPANSGRNASATAPIKTARAGVHCITPNRRVAIADTGKVRSVTDDMR